MSSIQSKISISGQVEDESKEYESECWRVSLSNDSFEIEIFCNVPSEGKEFIKWKALMRELATCTVNKVCLFGSLPPNRKNFNVRYVPLFCDAIKKNSVVTRLDVGAGVYIDDNGMRSICELLQTHATITRVWFIQDCHHSIIGAYLEKVLTVNNTIQTLQISVTAEEVIFVARALPHNSTLTKLDLWGLPGHKMGNKGLRILCEGLKRNRSITDINLGSSDISDEGTKDLCSVLAVNHSITSLDLRWNDIIALPSDFAFLTHIKTLNLTDNPNIRFPPPHILWNETRLFEFFTTFRYEGRKFHFLLGFQESW